ncbi:MAG: HIRAN domain-containing protein [Verrucomicrobia bacterium]|nr:HIRAN domain-containing protein [Verrucomicrobiota bacterium]
MNALLVASRSADPAQGGWSPIGRLEFDHAVYRFVYTQGARTAVGFTPFSGMTDLEEIYESDELFPVFANRLLPKSRPEYEAFLRWSGFDSASPPPDPIAVLGVTEGIRRTDMIEVFPCPAPDGQGSYSSKFFLHGLRYMPEVARARALALQPEELLFPMPDPCNRADPNAVALRTEDRDRLMLGYVPRYLAHDVWKLVQQCQPDFIQVLVHRVNRDAPLQQRLLCRMHACWPEGFQPCSGEEFQPIPQGVPAHCNG